MNKHQILQVASKSPQFAQAVQALDKQMQANPITLPQLDELITMMQFALKHPQAYPQIVEAAIKDGFTKPGDMPAQFDPTIVVSILAALYVIQTQMEARDKGHAKPHKMARGGLAQSARQLQSYGRNGDTMLAHINPQEARMLQQHGGSGSINPRTGLPEFFNLGSFLGAIIPIAVSIFAPEVAPMIGGWLGAEGAMAGVVGGAVIGGASAGLSGGNIGQGALMGGLGNGLGDLAGGAVNSGMGLGLGETGQQLLGAGMMGAAGGALTGQGMLQGAMQGVAGKYLGNQVQGMAGTGTAGQMLDTAGKTFGNAMTAGHDPASAATIGGLVGLSQGLLRNGENVVKPSDAVIDGLKASPNVGSPPSAGDFLPDVPNAGGYTQAIPQGGPQLDAPNAGGYAHDIPQGGASTQAPAPTQAPSASSAWSPSKLLMGAAVLGSLTGAPPAVQQAVSTLSPAQQKYFQQPLAQWDWGRLQKDAADSGISLNQYIARNWNSVYSGAYNKPTDATPKLAKGGPLSQIAYMARGSGSGRDDTIDARLSDGEYVMDAETVALLGDGSNQEGAKRLDEMRRNIRAQKGKLLAKGKISPNAKSPLTYMKGVA